MEGWSRISTVSVVHDVSTFVGNQGKKLSILRILNQRNINTAVLFGNVLLKETTACPSRWTFKDCFMHPIVCLLHFPLLHPLCLSVTPLASKKKKIFSMLHCLFQTSGAFKVLISAESNKGAIFPLLYLFLFLCSVTFIHGMHSQLHALRPSR